MASNSPSLDESILMEFDIEARSNILAGKCRTALAMKAHSSTPASSMRSLIVELVQQCSV